MVIPNEKTAIIKDAKTRVQAFEEQHAQGLITDGERYNKVVDIWSHTSDQVAKAMMDILGSETVGKC